MQKKLFILLVMLVAISAKAEEMVWVLQTDTEEKTEIADIDYMLAADSEKEFSIILKNGATIDGVKKATFSLISAVDDIVKSSALKLFPNPVAESLILSGCRQGMNIAILSLDGKTVKQAVAHGENLTIDVSNLSSGYYLLQTEQSTIKFIKK